MSLKPSAESNSAPNYPIKEIHHAYLTLLDGTRLAYRAWMPENAEQSPVPVILEYLPYRKNDGTVIRDEITMPQTAAQGYACVRVDIRGCGESEGIFGDEYCEQELQDGEEVIAWLANQPWCDGNVGMVGISWGGFNSLQLAYRQPPALKAIITQCSTDDRYRDDVHYAGGCLLNDNLDWAAFFWAYSQARAPDARWVGDNWQAIWQQRLECLPNLTETWLSHQRRDAYWQHGSVCEDYSRIQIPVYAIGGFADAYRNTVFSLLENLTVPCKGLIGPWAHKYPNIAYPAPKIDYVTESVRWWDHWLKGRDTGIMDEPAFHYYLLDSVPPQADYDYRPGSWQALPRWPSPAVENQAFYFSRQQLQTTPNPKDEALSICSPETVGLAGGRYCVGIRLAMENPVDQRSDDAGSLVFDSEVLSEDYALIGQALAKLCLSSDKSQANIAIRINDVQPDGAVTRVTYGVLNLTHRQSHAEPSAIEINQPFSVDVPLNGIAYQFKKGHRIRIAISTAYWPLIWPARDKATLTLHTDGSHILLPKQSSLNVSPVSSGLAADITPVSFAGEKRGAENSERRIIHDAKTGITTLETADDFGGIYYQSADSEVDFSLTQTQSINATDPLSAHSEMHLMVKMGRDGWRTELQARYAMRADADYFYIDTDWQTFVAGKSNFQKSQQVRVPRDFT